MFTFKCKGFQKLLCPFCLRRIKELFRLPLFFDHSVLQKDHSVSDCPGKLHFMWSNLNSGGQCLMSPPVNVSLDNIPTALYNAGGALANLLCAIVAMLLLKYFGGMHIGLRYFLAFTITVGSVFALNTGIPLKWGGFANDGQNLLNLKRNKQSVKGFATLLILNEKLQNGMRQSEMPDEFYDLGESIDYSDPLQANVGLARMSREIYKGNIELAHEQLNELLHNHGHEMMPLFRMEATCELVFTSLATGNIELAKSNLDDKLLMKYITKSARVMSSKQRILIAKALLLDRNHAEAERLYNEMVAKRESYLYQGEVKDDIELMKNLLYRRNVVENQVNSSN